MKTNDTIKMAALGLTLHKSRSALTILGIVIGITSIILVMSLGQSAQQLIIGEIQGLGSANVYVIPGREPSGFDGGLSTILTDSIKQRDIDDLSKKNNVPDAITVNPVVFWPVAVNYNSEVYNSTLIGSTEGIADFFDVKLAKGSMYTYDDIVQRSDVAVIGTKVAEKLFGLSDPIGEKIKIKSKSLRVIGVFAPKGQSPFVNFDEAVIAPYTTAQQYILGIKHFQRVTIQASSPDTINNVISDVKAVLRANHNITDPEKDDFFIQTQDDLVKTIGTITTVLTVLLTSVAAISLIVGGVGIMNIMFVSVTERTREIGLRKAVGATDKDILLQFLAEAVMLTFSGGVVGIILGTLLNVTAVAIVNRALGINFPFIFSYMGAFLGVTVSSLIGLTFGIFPARSAAKKSPIEALRYE
jgi:putative ABC transport system permease protein